MRNATSTIFSQQIPSDKLLLMNKKINVNGGNSLKLVTACYLEFVLQ